MTDIREYHFGLLLWMSILEKHITLLGINDELLNTVVAHKYASYLHCLMPMHHSG